MQRRAAAVSAAIFLLLAVGAYGVLGVSTQPPIETEVAAEATTGSTVEFGGTTYNVTELGAASGGEATFQWRNESWRYTVEFTNNSTTMFSADASQTDWDDTNMTYRVLVDPDDDPTTFTLREVQEVDEPTVTRNGTTYVVTDSDGDGTDELIPRDEYLDEPRTATFAVGDALDYANNTTTVGSVTSEAVVLEWEAPRTVSRTVSDGNNITLGGEPYIAYFLDLSQETEGPERVVLTQDQAGYQDSIDRRAYWTDRMRGLWGVVVLGLLGGMGLLAMAYLPSRY
jgi:hypothetical protein